MAADSAGNDLSAAKIVVTSAYRFAPYDATQKLTADLIAPTVADEVVLRAACQKLTAHLPHY